MNGDILSSISLGICLGAACGFRSLLPAFLFSVAVATGNAGTAPAFDWLGSTAAIAIFGAGALIEIAGSFLAAADRHLDLVSAPLAMVTASFLTLGSLRSPGIAEAILIPLLAGMLVAGVSASLVSLMRTRALPEGARTRSALLELAGATAFVAAGLLAPEAGAAMALLSLGWRRHDLRTALGR